jgi:hypothetical protein
MLYQPAKSLTLDASLLTSRLPHWLACGDVGF